MARGRLARALERVRRARRAQELAREVPAGDADADRAAAGVRRARDPRDRRAALRRPLPRADPLSPVPDRDRPGRDDLRGHPLPGAALSRPARQRALALPLDGRRAPHVCRRQGPRRRSCRCSRSRCCPCCCCSSATRSSPTRRAGYLADHWGDIVRIVASGVLLASYVSLLGLAVASFTSRRAFALGTYAGVHADPDLRRRHARRRRRARQAPPADHARARCRSPRRARSTAASRIPALRARRAGGGGSPAAS